MTSKKELRSIIKGHVESEIALNGIIIDQDEYIAKLFEKIRNLERRIKELEDRLMSESEEFRWTDTSGGMATHTVHVSNSYDYSPPGG